MRGAYGSGAGGAHGVYKGDGRSFLEKHWLWLVGGAVVVVMVLLGVLITLIAQQAAVPETMQATEKYYYSDEAGEELVKGETAARERLTAVEGILERNAWLMDLPRTVEYYTEGYAEYVKYVISYEFDESEAGFHVLVEDYTGGNLEAAQGWVMEQKVADGGVSAVEVVYKDLTGEKL